MTGRNAGNQARYGYEFVHDICNAQVLTADTLHIAWLPMAVDARTLKTRFASRRRRIAHVPINLHERLSERIYRVTDAHSVRLQRGDAHNTNDASQRTPRGCKTQGRRSAQLLQGEQHAEGWALMRRR
jgi:hypothetical protein